MKFFVCFFVSTTFSFHITFTYYYVCEFVFKYWSKKHFQNKDNLEHLPDNPDIRKTV